MPFLKRDVNLNLLSLILIIVVLFVGTNLFYHVKLNSIQTEYDEKIEELEALAVELEAQQKNLDDSSKLKDLAKKDRDALEEICSNLKNKILVLEFKKNELEENFGNFFQKSICKTTGNAECL